STGGPATGLAKWNGTAWTALDDFDNVVWALTVYDDGDGPQLCAAGSFTQVGCVSAQHLAKWNGSSWSSFDAWTSLAPFALIVHDDGGGATLYPGGQGHVRRWRDRAWERLGDGIAEAVDALAMHDDGSGGALYVGGSFTRVGHIAANRVARWDGA